jgi:protein-S-isoprenylcysteine O-methyltransferase Ste14
MSTVQSTRQGQTGGAGGLGWKAIVRFAIVVLIQPAILFAAAGRLDWLMGWAYVALLLVMSAGSRLVVARKYPDLIAERAQSLDREDVDPWDKLLVSVVAIFGPIAGIMVAGLDRRFGWSPQIPLGLELLALAVALVGLLFGTWAMLENRFFSAVVRIQKDRQQTVVSSGPYRFLRHPSYAGGIATNLAIPVMLGALWALIPYGLIVIGYVVRTEFEDRKLLAELDGYRDYARRVRNRLLPWVW